MIEAIIKEMPELADGVVVGGAKAVGILKEKL